MHWVDPSKCTKGRLRLMEVFDTTFEMEQASHTSVTYAVQKKSLRDGKSLN